MATSLASSLVWGEGNRPTIYLDISYDASRSGADMKYTVYFTVRKPSGSYGYNIYISASFDNGAASWGGYIKNNSTSSWSSYSTNTGSKTVSNKTSGSTKLVVNAYSPNGQSSRDTTWTYYLPVSAAGSNITASDGTLGVSQNITITKQNASFTDTVTYTCGSASGTIATDSTATTIAWTPPITLAQQNTTGNTVSVTLTTTTKSGSTTIQSKTTTITETIPNTSDFLPTATLALSDNNGYASTFGGYVQGESALKATITSSGKQGATITNNVITLDGTNYTGTSPIVLPPFLSSGSRSVTATVTDSRGKTTTTAAQTITVLPYSPPVISDTSAFRCSSNGTPQADGEYVVLTMKSASMTPVPATGTNRNTPTYRVRYKRSTDSGYTTYTWTSATGTSVTNLSTPTTGSGYPISLASGATMEVIFEVVDQFETTQSTRTVAVATKFIDTNETKTGLAIGQVSTKDGFQVAFDTFYSNDVQHETAGAGVFAEDVQSISAPSTVIPVMYGGTGADNAIDARENLGVTTANLGLTGLFMVEAYTPSDTAQISSGDATVWKSFTLGDVPSGYTPIAVVQYYLGGGVGYACSLYNITIGVSSGKTVVNTAWHNTNAGAGSVKFNSISILYLKTAFITNG